MGKYILKRVLWMIPVIVGVIFIIFLIMEMAPGDPARMILGDMATEEAVAVKREELGLDAPFFVRFFRYMGNLCRGDMGKSYYSNLAVSQEIAQRLWNTVELALFGMAIAVVLALPLGLVAAVKQNTFLDTSSMFVALLGLSMPQFWLALLLMLLFSLKLNWFPVSGAGSFKHLVLPGIAVGFSTMAAAARTVRSSMLEVIREDYVRTARSKGIEESKVIFRHALPNAMIPTITMIGLQTSNLLGGTVLIETVFSWPGIGRLLVSAVNSRDTPLVLGCMVVLAAMSSIMNLLVDLTYGLFDPRLKVGSN